ncbi:MAG: class I SAM-dependent methyltransferase [Burkholderiales bacterium]|nr:class I SAM-dependent methyltransferase [Burkholderiales bacterium]
MRWWQVAALCASLAANTVQAQERFSIFAGSSPEAVERMVKLAELRDGDRVVDLGSGDGRIIFTALDAHPGVRGWGVDLDPKLVKEATAEAQKRGLAERVQFLHQNAFDADLSKADVIFMWLWPEVMYMLRAKILREARPGTRVVTNIWDLGSWKPDYIDETALPVNLWRVPAKVGGYWNWTLPMSGIKHNYAAVFEQHFQQLEGVVRSGDRRGVFKNLELHGAHISFSLDMTLDGEGLIRHHFSGTVDGDRIDGTVRTVLILKGEETAERLELPWQATRSTTSAYFEPTGLVIR